MKGHYGLQNWQLLRDEDVRTVRLTKKEILYGAKSNIKLAGRHEFLAGFLTTFARLCGRSLTDQPYDDIAPLRLTFEKVVKVMEETITALPEDPPLPVAEEFSTLHILAPVTETTSAMRSCKRFRSASQEQDDALTKRRRVAD